MASDYYRNYRVAVIQLSTQSTANSGLCSNVMIEEGSTATMYTEYVDVNGTTIETYDGYGLIDEYRADTNGVFDNVKPYNGATNITTNDASVVLDVEYNRDINKAFEELTQAIISLGGNV